MSAKTEVRTIEGVGASPVRMTLCAGLTISEIIVRAVPSSREKLHFRVALVDKNGMCVVSERAWRRVRPKTGVSVVIRIVPGTDQLRSILSIVVSIAAVALGQFWLGPLLAGTFGISAGGWAALSAVGICYVGGFNLETLLPSAMRGM